VDGRWKMVDGRWKIYTETYSERIKAREREKYLKSGVGKEFLKKLIQ
jgi:hypothetical protein